MAQIIDLGKFRFNWMGDFDIATEYERNDVVKYGGNVYVYTLNAAATGNLPTDTDFWALMLEGFNYRGDWATGTSYELSDLVTFGGKVYLALRDTVGDNPATSASDWEVFVEGIQYEGAWSSSTGYQVGDVVKYGGVVYIALTNSTNSTPSPSSSAWEILVYGLEYKGTYDDTVSYKLNDIVLYGGTSYIALQPGTGNEPTPGSFWGVFVEGFQFEGEWDDTTTYQTGDIVNYGGIVYVALQDSLNTSPTTTAYWAILIEGISWKSTYSGSTTYNKNDIVVYGGSSWIAKQNTTGNTPVSGDNWDILAAGTFPDYSAAAGQFLSNDGTVVEWVSDVTVDTITANAQIFAGANAPDKETDKDLTNAVAVFSFDNGTEDSGFAQIAFTNSDPTSSTDIQVIANNGNDSSGWATFGITGSNFDDTLYGITGDNDAYLFYSAPEEITKTITNKALTGNVATLTTGTAHGITVGAKAVIADVGAPFDGTYYVTAVPTTTTFTYSKTNANVTSAAVSPEGSVVFNGGAGGNLVFATGENGTDNKIIFAAGGFDSGTTQMEITPDVNVHIEINTPSTSPTTGALTVVGGVGIQGDMNIQGDVAIVGTISFGGEGTTVSTANLAVDAPMIFSGTNNVDDVTDLGLIGEYATTISPNAKTVSNKALTGNVATLTTSTSHGYAIGDVVTITDVDATFNGTFIITAIGGSGTTFDFNKTATNVSSTGASGTATVNKSRRWAGFARDASDGVWKLFKNSSAKPTTTVDFSNATLAYDSAKVGAATADTITALTSITSTAGTNALKDLTVSGTSSSFGGTIAGDATFSGNPTFSGTPVFSGAPSFTGTPTFTGGVRVQEMIEDVVDVALSSNAATLDYSAANIFWLTNTPSANMTWNITNAPTTDGRVFTINVVVTQGSTGYIPSTFTINGGAITMKWAAGVTPTATSSSGKFDIFTLTLVRRSSSYQLLGSANLNF